MENLFFDLKRLKYLGEGAIVGKCVRIRRPELVVIGDHTIIDDFTYISCALEIGAHCHVAPNVTMSGGGQTLTIGSYVGIAAGCSIHVASSDYIMASLDLPSVPEKYHFGGTSEAVTFGDHVLLGAHSVVLPGVHLPEGFASAALTVIRKHQYEPWTLYGGYECRKLTRRSNKKLFRVLETIEADAKQGPG